MSMTFLLVMLLLVCFFFMSPKEPLEEEWEYQMRRKAVKEEDEYVFVRVGGLGEKSVPTSYELVEWIPLRLRTDGKRVFPEHTCCGDEHFVRLRNSNLDKIMAFECEKCGQKYVVVFEETA